MTKQRNQKAKEKNQRAKKQKSAPIFDPTSFVRRSVPFIFTAVMLTVIQAPIGLSIFAWVAFVPFIVAFRPEAEKRGLFFISYIVSVFYWIGNLYWLIPITPIGGLTLCLYTGLLWPLLGLCLRFCRAKKVPLFIATAVLIVGIERMQGLFLGGFFWRFLAHSQYKNITLIQIADIFGAGGVSFLVAMVNGLLAELVIAARQKKFFTISQFIKTGVVICGLTCCILYGRFRISQEEQFVRQGPLVASLQSNVPQSVKETFEAGEILFSDLMELSRAAADTGAEFIIWPETMVQSILDESIWPILLEPEQNISYDQNLKEHAKDKAYVLVGAYGGKINADKDGKIYLGQYNSAYLYTPTGEQAPEKYNKIHLVPFGEVLPFRRTIPALYNFLMKFTPYDYDYSLEYGSEYTVFNMPSPAQDYRFSVMICYEDTVPSIGRKFALDENGNKRIDWLINISNDGWFVRFKEDRVLPSTELAQHVAVCAFRAIENRLAVVRSVNTGISCLIDSSGRIKDDFINGTLPEAAMARTAVQGWFLDRIPIDERTSFFSKYGEWLDYLCQFCVISLIILWFVSNFFRFIKK